MRHADAFDTSGITGTEATGLLTTGLKLVDKWRYSQKAETEAFPDVDNFAVPAGRL